MTEIILLLHNIRSTHNVGALFRTADGMAVEQIICSGYTPYPEITNDRRLPHLREKITRDIKKTALGAEKTVPFTHSEQPPLDELKEAGYRLVALEQDPRSISIEQYSSPPKIALLLGEEVHGVSAELLDRCDDIIEIPMRGQKESFNVSVAAGIALYQLAED